jgi:hypothetical protein
MIFMEYNPEIFPQGDDANGADDNGKQKSIPKAD